jgi:hypothetical protein
MSIRDSLQQVLHVAPTRGTQHATNCTDTATGSATPHATTDRKASKHAEVSATPDATPAQHLPKTDATNDATQPPPAQHIMQQAHKAHRERRRAKVLSMLEKAPGRKYAVFVEDDTTDPVICAVAIRGVATFEMAIPHHSYNGMVLLELVEKHSAEPS